MSASMSTADRARRLLAKLDDEDLAELGTWVAAAQRQALRAQLMPAEVERWSELWRDRRRRSPMRAMPAALWVEGLPGRLALDLYEVTRRMVASEAERAQLMAGQVVRFPTKAGLVFSVAVDEELTPSEGDAELFASYFVTRRSSGSWVVRRTRQESVDKMVQRRHPWLRGARVASAIVSLRDLVETYWPVRLAQGTMRGLYGQASTPIVGDDGPRVLRREVVGVLMETRPLPSALEVALAKGAAPELRTALMHDVADNG